MAFSRSSTPLPPSAPDGGGVGVRRDGFELPAQATAVADARARVRVQLRSWGLPEDLGCTAQLVVSEFFTNVVVHTDSCRVRCRLQLCSERLRIEVCDEGGECGQVLPRQASAEDVSGRGLQLVGAVAEKWGVQPDPQQRGRVVWAELSLTVR